MTPPEAVDVTPPKAEAAEPGQDGEQAGEWGYVPMSEWLDEIDSSR